MKPSDLFLAGTTTVTPASEFDSQTLAVLRGRLVRYLMRSREVSLIWLILWLRGFPHCDQLRIGKFLSPLWPSSQHYNEREINIL